MNLVMPNGPKMMLTLGPLTVTVATKSPQMQMNVDMSHTGYEPKGQAQALGIQTFVKLYSKLH
jgi:hypothetical protein